MKSSFFPPANSCCASFTSTRKSDPFGQSEFEVMTVNMAASACQRCGRWEWASWILTRHSDGSNPEVDPGTWWKRKTIPLGPFGCNFSGGPKNSLWKTSGGVSKFSEIEDWTGTQITISLVSTFNKIKSSSKGIRLRFHLSFSDVTFWGMSFKSRSFAIHVAPFKCFWKNRE